MYPSPNTRLVGESVYASDATAAAAVSGIFQTIAGNSIGGGFNGFSAILGLTGDELTLYPTSNQVFREAYNNQLSDESIILFWSDLYTVLYQANVAIESLKTSTAVSAAMKTRLYRRSQICTGLLQFLLD